VTFSWFSYNNLNPFSVDKRIKQKPTFCSFCLRLPQHKCYKKEGTVEETFSPATKKKPGKSKMTGLVGKVLKLIYSVAQLRLRKRAFHSTTMIKMTLWQL